MEFGALVCKPKEPDCQNCKLNNICIYFKSKNKFVKTLKVKPETKSYNIFCYIYKEKNQIALTKKKQSRFFKKFLFTSNERS